MLEVFKKMYGNNDPNLNIDLLHYHAWKMEEMVPYRSGATTAELMNLVNVIMNNSNENIIIISDHSINDLLNEIIRLFDMYSIEILNINTYAQFKILIKHQGHVCRIHWIRHDRPENIRGMNKEWPIVLIFRNRIEKIQFIYKMERFL
ncbi:MAG TPA: hypothetical protein VI815_02860 [Candidatus Nanoarchaeia archaeon]|nr:hypothetical protein [Candidatus Nanoarchaeia archaeon]